ncbi:hypothetical protein LUZ60_008675 [Juncus effusus]|nr:hypothetical protein LUZ60_008675 [Juncus effusus]
MAMVCLSSSLLTWPPSRAKSMEIVCEPSLNLSSLGNFRRTGCGCTNYFGHVRRRIWHSTLRTNFQSHSNSSSLIPLSSADSSVICEGLCRVIWSIEADLLNGSVIFLTGDPVSLGCWDPDLAISFSPSLQDTNLWEAEIKVPYGINFKYNYFVRKSSSLIEWRPGPECSLSIPFFTGDVQLVRVKDCWLRNVIHRLPFPSFGSWLFNLTDKKDEIVREDANLGENEILTRKNGALTKEDHHDQVDGQDRVEIRDKNESWISEFLLSGSLNIEEKEKEIIKEKEKEVGSTTILINSSVCTTQRIAVLEEGKLVELLLEPVKNKVQCDNIYLGVITKMAPHLGGAFVDIGAERNSLLDGVFGNKEPFVFGTEERETEERERGEREEMEEREEEEVIEGVYEERESFEEDLEEREMDGADADLADSVRELLGNKGKKKGDTANKKNQRVNLKKGTKILVQVIKEGLGSKGPTVTAYPTLKSRFWVLRARNSNIGVSSKIIGSERTRLKEIAKLLQPDGFNLTVRTVAAGHPLEELQKDLESLLITWKKIMRRAKIKAAKRDGPVLVHRAMGRALNVVEDYFNHKVKKMVVDSPSTYNEIMGYLKVMEPELCERVELYDKKIPLFDAYKIEDEINGILSKRVPLQNGGSLVIEQTEALVSIDVNSGEKEFEDEISQEKAALDVNLEAAKQIARELRLRDIGGIIIVDFINMTDDRNKWLVYKEMSIAIKQDRSTVNVYELSNLGLMQISRKRVRPSVSFMISDPCTCCEATGRVEALEMSFLKIENEIRRFIAKSNKKPDPKSPKTWPKFSVRVDEHMKSYLTSFNGTKLALLSISLNVRISIETASAFPRGEFELFPLNYEKKKDRDKQELVAPPIEIKRGQLLLESLRSQKRK